MRILHLVARSHRRGAELVALELAEELDALGHSNRILALVPAADGAIDPRLPPLVSHLGRSTGGLPVDTVARVLCVARLRRLVAAEPVDVVLAHGGWPANVAAFGLPSGGPVLVWQRILGFPDALWRGPRRRFWNAVARRVDAAVALTAPDEAEMRRLGFAGPVWVIPNFRRPERFLAVERDAAAQALRREVGVSEKVALVGFVGHLVTQKRPERTLDVLEALHRRGHDVHLVIAGDGPLRPRLEREAAERGLTGSVSMLGHRDDVEDIFGGVVVSLLTSDFEGMPGVAIEAQLAGCPVVSFPVGGVDEVIDDGGTGFVLARPDTGLMADRVAQLLDDRPLRVQMGAAARVRGAHFGARQSAATYEAHLNAHLAGAAAGPRPGRRAGRGRRAPSLQERLPNLFVLGAPKAGTTFVHEALRLAPDVYMSEVKEPGFFTSREYRLGLEHYVKAYFRGANGSALRGESTPWYLYSDEARERIAALPVPEPPKLLVLVRRPADRARSMHGDQVRIRRESRPFARAVDDELRALERGEHPDDIRARYVWCGLYSRPIEAWRATFGADAVEIVVFEELAADGDAVWTALSTFLQHPLGSPTFDQVSERGRNVEGDLRWPRLDRFIRSFEGRDLRAVELAKRGLPPGTHRRVLQGLGRLNRHPSGPRSEVDVQTLTRLDEFFAEEHRRMEAMLGRPIEAWRSARVPD
jgi:glycosyltransferase involved in cell wall biosynthesis